MDASTQPLQSGVGALNDSSWNRAEKLAAARKKLKAYQEKRQATSIKPVVLLENRHILSSLSFIPLLSNVHTRVPYTKSNLYFPILTPHFQTNMQLPCHTNSKFQDNISNVEKELETNNQYSTSTQSSSDISTYNHSLYFPKIEVSLENSALMEQSLQTKKDFTDSNKLSSISNITEDIENVDQDNASILEINESSLIIEKMQLNDQKYEINNKEEAPIQINDSIEHSIQSEAGEFHEFCKNNFKDFVYFETHQETNVSNNITNKSSESIEYKDPLLCSHFNYFPKENNINDTSINKFDIILPHYTNLNQVKISDLKPNYHESDTILTSTPQINYSQPFELNDFNVDSKMNEKIQDYISQIVELKGELADSIREKSHLKEEFNLLYASSDRAIILEKELQELKIIHETTLNELSEAILQVNVLSKPCQQYMNSLNQILPLEEISSNMNNETNNIEGQFSVLQNDFYLLMSIYKDVCAQLEQQQQLNVGLSNQLNTVPEYIAIYNEELDLLRSKEQEKDTHIIRMRSLIEKQEIEISSLRELLLVNLNQKEQKDSHVASIIAAHQDDYTLWQSTRTNLSPSLQSSDSI